MRPFEFGLFMFLLCMIVNYGADMAKPQAFEHGVNVGLSVFVGLAWWMMKSNKEDDDDEVRSNGDDSGW